MKHLCSKHGWTMHNYGGFDPPSCVKCDEEGAVVAVFALVLLFAALALVSDVIGACERFSKPFPHRELPVGTTTTVCSAKEHYTIACRYGELVCPAKVYPRICDTRIFPCLDRAEVSLDDCYYGESEYSWGIKDCNKLADVISIHYKEVRAGTG